MRADVFTLFPQAFDWYLTQVHIRSAQELGHEVQPVELPRHTPLSHLQVDDTPYGGGAGMVLRIDVVCAALEAAFGVDAAAVRDDRRVVELTPKGRQLDRRPGPSSWPAATWYCSAAATRASTSVSPTWSATACPSVPTWSTGGEVPAMVLLDAVTRKLPGVISNPMSVVSESHSSALEGDTEYPHYTRPAEFRGWEVPEVLLSGHHAAIERWRAAMRGGRASGHGEA